MPTLQRSSLPAGAKKRSPTERNNAMTSPPYVQKEEQSLPIVPYVQKEDKSNATKQLEERIHITINHQKATALNTIILKLIIIIVSLFQ